MADIKVRVGQQPAVKVASSLGGAQGGSLAELSDVTISNPGDGTLLVYNSTTKKFEGTNTLTTGNDQNLTINGGVF
jgi:hypothetical protein|tara:strand:+ start:2028 stop:2255 length:228 start_codon:yes stop_codon:yes gene_type:complete